MSLHGALATPDLFRCSGILVSSALCTHSFLTKRLRMVHAACCAACGKPEEWQYQTSSLEDPLCSIAQVSCYTGYRDSYRAEHN